MLIPDADRPLGDVQERQAIAKLEREDLEDKFLRLREQNIVSECFRTIVDDTDSLRFISV